MCFMEEEKMIYRLNDDISFRKCSLFSGKSIFHGDCTDFQEKEENWKSFFYCNNYGIHLHCTHHPEIELNRERDFGTTILSCPRCKNRIEVRHFGDLINECLRMLNIEKFKGAKLIRLDDWYVPAVKKKEHLESDYWITTDVKTDKDGDTMVVVYVGHKGAEGKAQFFIKPEKLQLTSDHKDMDPAKVLSKIEVTLKDRKLVQEYDF